MIDKYTKLCDKLDKLKDDNEYGHILQDKIYRKFIRDVTNEKVKGNDIKKIADLIKKRVFKYDKNRWYA